MPYSGLTGQGGTRHCQPGGLQYRLDTRILGAFVGCPVSPASQMRGTFQLGVVSLVWGWPEAPGYMCGRVLEEEGDPFLPGAQDPQAALERETVSSSSIGSGVDKPV